MRPTLTFDGKGINGPDEYRTRVATFESDGAAEVYGPLLAAAPELLAALRAAENALEGRYPRNLHKGTATQKEARETALAIVRAAIKAATGRD